MYLQGLPEKCTLLHVAAGSCVSGRQGVFALCPRSLTSAEMQRHLPISAKHCIQELMSKTCLLQMNQKMYIS